MLALLGPVLNFFGGPVITGLINAYKAKLDAGNTQEQIAADLAARELAVQQVEIQAQNQLRIAEIGRWYEPDHLFLYTLFIYFLYGIADSLAGLPVPKLTPELDQWAGIMIMFLFGKRGIENVVRIIKR
jgi:hypothetical protein